MNNKIVLITGGTSGIGKFLVEKLLSKPNNKIIVIAKDEQKIRECKKEFSEHKNRIRFFKTDLNNSEEIEETFNEINQNYDYIDVLINNAAYDKMDSIENYTYEEFSKIINTNLLGKMFCIQNSINLLKNSSYPVVINIASRLATKPMLNSTAYCCAASAIVMLTKCAALELKDYKIRVNSISPSLTLTPLALKSYDVKTINETAKNSTRDRNCNMTDIYNLVCFLSSKKSDYINGENVNLSGGLLLK